MKKRGGLNFSVASLAALAALGAAAQDCEARYAGIVSSEAPMTFTSQSESVWGAGQSVDGFSKSFDLFNVSVPKQSPSFGSTVDLWGGTFGGKLTPSLEWKMGMAGRLYDFDSGAVKLQWPAVVTLTMDEPNSYGPGDTVTINSEYRVPDSGYLTATPPRFSVDLTGNFFLDFSASLKGCLGACGSYSIFPPINLDKNFTLLRLTSTGLSFPDIPAQHSYAVPHLMSWCESYVTNVEGFLDFPNGYVNLPGTTGYVNACSEASAPVDFAGAAGGEAFPIQLSETAARSGDRKEVFQEETSYGFLDLSVDLDGLVDPTGLLGQNTPTVSGISGSYDLLDVSTKLDLAYKQTLKFEPALKMRIDFPEAVTFKVAGGEWQTAPSTLLTVGQSLELKLPENKPAPTSNPTVYSLDNTFTSTTKVQPAANVNYSAAKIEAHLPAVTGFAESIFKTVCDCPGWAEPLCLAVNLVCDEVLDRVLYHDYGKVDIDEAIVDGKEIAGYSASIPLRSYTGTLGGISPQGGSPITIDPEDPQMQLEAEVSRVINHGGGKRTVVYTMSVNNSGDVPLKNVTVQDSLAKAFATAPAFSVPEDGLRSCNLQMNQSFSSPSAEELLSSPILLDDGRDPNPAPVSQLTGGTVQVEVDVRPGLYPQPFVNTFKASGTSWFRGTPVSREAQAAVDLGPARLKDLDDFAVYADKKVLMKEPALVRGSVGSNDAVEIQNGSNTLIAGDIRSLGNVDVHGAVTVDYIFTNLLLNLGDSGSVNGLQNFDLRLLREVNEYVAPVMQRFELPALSIESDGPSLTIPGQSSNKQVLAPGAYGVVKVAAGAKVLLKGGGTDQSYSFRDLYIEDGATVLLDVSAGPLAVNVAHAVKIGKNVKMDFDHQRGSTREVSFNIASQGRVMVGRSSRILGTWLAPLASVNLDANSRLEGAVYCDFITMERGSRVEYHEEPWMGNLYKGYNDSCPVIDSTPVESGI